MPDKSDVEKTRELIAFGAEVAGSVASGVIGFLVAGPIGAIAGGALEPALSKGMKVIADFYLRDLSQRERVKAGAGIAFAYSKIIKYLEKGNVPRDDGFFERDVSSRSASDEILEGVLFKCKSEHEEKKLRFIGNIYANVAFMPEVSIEEANWLLQSVQNFTYRQLCMLALVHQKREKGISWGPNDGDPAFEAEYKEIDHMLARDHTQIAYELYEKTGEGLRINGLSRIGEFCYMVMGLNDIPEEDLANLKRHFPHSFNEAISTKNKV